MYIAEIYTPGTTFVLLLYGSTFICFYTAGCGKSYIAYSRSRSFNVIEVVTTWKSMCDFLLVFHCNYMHIFYRFRDITICRSKICVFWPFSPTSVSCEAFARSFLLGAKVWKWSQKTWLPGGENRVILRLLVLTHYHHVTDRHARRLCRGL